MSLKVEYERPYQLNEPESLQNIILILSYNYTRNCNFSSNAFNLFSNSI